MPKNLSGVRQKSHIYTWALSPALMKLKHQVCSQWPHHSPAVALQLHLVQVFQNIPSVELAAQLSITEKCADHDSFNLKRQVYMGKGSGTALSPANAGTDTALGFVLCLHIWRQAGSSNLPDWR